MPKLFFENDMFERARVLPYGEFVPFCDLKWDKNAVHAEETVQRAEDILDREVPSLPATLYMQYYRTGNRSNFESPYFARRNNLFTLTVAELTEKKGRFTDKIIDYVWAICEESTWVIPAHYAPCHGNPKNCLCDAFNLNDGDDVRYIDLFSAETGAVLAWVWYLLEDELNEVTPVIRRRIRDMLGNRILHPYYTYDNMNWVGKSGNVLNNWTPWIISNVLVVVMLCETDFEKREFSTKHAMTILDRFTSFYKSDGGCDEGPGYWNVAGASYFDCLEILWDLTGGTVDLFRNPFVRKMGEYIADFNLTGNVFVNFADAGHLISPDYAMIARYGRRCGSDKLTAFAAGKPIPPFNPSYSTYRKIKNLSEPAPISRNYAAPEDNIFYSGLEVFISKNRENGMSLAVKGGTNRESHNHNDIGSFILFHGEKPVFIDPGVETYSRKTFSSERYTIWTMRSLYHNLPEINGTEQHAGDYHAEVVSFDGSSIALELKDAYPAEAGIRSYIRVAKLTSCGAEITDRIALAAEGEAVFTLMTTEKPEEAGENRFVLPDAGCSAEYDEGLTLTLDSVPLTDPKLHREWKVDALSRILLSSGKFTEKTFALRVEAVTQ
ncbi:MAG: heparinase II/III family protein [Eubacteriales bacterium]